MVIDSAFFLHRRDLGLAVPGKEIIERLGGQILNSRVMLSRQKLKLLLDRRRKTGGSLALTGATGRLPAFSSWWWSIDDAHRCGGRQLNCKVLF